MRKNTMDYFLGMLFSKMLFIAYGTASGITTVLQLFLIYQDHMRFDKPLDRVGYLPEFVEVYIETLFPVWIGSITTWNLVMILFNIVLALLILMFWALSYDQA